MVLLFVFISSDASAIFLYPAPTKKINNERRISVMVHLHVHSHYSLLDGTSSVKGLVQAAKKNGHKALALTDHGFMYGTVEFYRACMDADIKPILGVELYITKNLYDKERETSHIVLLAKNDVGYQNLVKIASMAATDGFYYRPRCDLALLEKYKEGIICLSACLSGEIPKLCLDNKYDQAKELAGKYKEIFGDDYYIELQYHGLPEQKTILPRLIRLAKDLDIKTVATNDVHYLNKEDAEAQRVLMCISTKKDLDDPTGLGYGNPSEWYYKSEEEMRAIFDKIAPGAVERTEEIADKCNVTLPTGVYHLPEFPTPEKWADNFSYLRALCRGGLQKRYGSNAGKHEAQLEYELETIKKMGFVDYILITFDFISYAKRSGIPVGPGRGSAAGSLVCYCLGITDLDPIQYGLKFERFLNPERVTMPDIDIDFDVPDGREAVVAYVAEKYGQRHVAQIITFGTLAAKSALRDVGKTLGMQPSETAKLTALVPSGPGVTLEEALKTSSVLQKLYHEDEKVKRVIDIARKIEGTPRNTSVHAAGVILAPSDVDDYIPICRNPNGEQGLLLSQFSMANVESVGMLKVDFLGLRTLTIMRDAEERINRGWPKDEWLNIWSVPYDDSTVYEMLSKGETKGVFQLESEGMRDVLRKLKPTCLEDLIAVIALYRPGPMDSIPKFIEGKQNPDKVVYKHPLLKPILETTYGTIVYQEQVMEIVRTLAGYSYGRSDLVRRAMAKKKPAVLATEKEYFLNGKVNEDGSVECDGCIKRGIPKEIAEQLWHEMEDFASYAFNKSHAAAYATVAYRTAYLRRHFGLEFQAATMTNCLDNTDKLLSFLDDCENRGIKVLPPDVNKSDAGFEVEDGGIRFGLLAVKGTSKVTIQQIVSARQGNPYEDMQDLMWRCPQACDKKTMEALIKSGAFDSFEQNRAQMLSVLPLLLKSAKKARTDVLAEQISLEDAFFTQPGETTRPKDFSFARIDYPDIPDLPQSEKLEQELEVTGLYISGHPMAEYKEIVRNKVTHKITDLLATNHGGDEEEGEIDPTSYVVPKDSNVRVAGLVSLVKEITTKKDKKRMCSLTLADQTAKLNATVFPRAFEAYGEGLKVGTPVILFGKLDDGDFGRKLIVNSVEFLAKSAAEASAEQNHSS